MRWARPLLLAYAVLLVVILFSPTSDVQSSLVRTVSDVLRTFLPGHLVRFSRAEVALNAVIIAPLSLLGTLSFPRLRWHAWTAYGFLGSCVVELLQGLLLPGRQASFSDIVANTAGALLGGLLGALAVRARGHGARGA